MDQKLLNYIKESRKKGFSNEQIKKALLDTGWKQEDVDKALKPILEIKESFVKKSKTKKILPIIIIILILAGVSAAAYIYLYQDPSEKIILNIIEKAKDIKSFHYQIDLEVIGVPSIEDFNTDELFIESSDFLSFFASVMPLPPVDQEQEGKLHINLEGDVDFNDASNPKFSFLLDAWQETISEDKLNLDIRFIDKSFYFKLGTLPKIAFLDLESLLKDRWIEIKTQNLKELVGELGLEETPNPEFNLIQEQIDQIEELAEEMNLFTLDNLEKSTTNGIEIYKIKFVGNIVEFERFFTEINKMIPLPYTEAELEEIREIINNIESIKGELWINRKKYSPYSVSIVFQYSDEDIEGVGTLIISELNKKVDILKPEGATSFEDILDEILNSIFETQMQEMDFLL